MIGWLFDTMIEPWIGEADDREPYYRDDDGQAMSLVVVGPQVQPGVYDTPQHEGVIHDGTGHQDSVVENRSELRWFLFFPYWVDVQYRHYGLTVNEAEPDLDAINGRIGGMRLRRHQEVYVAPMSKRIERKAIRTENGTQMRRGVSW